MNVRFTMRDIKRLCRELNVSREEAVRLLRQSSGDYQQAVRSHISRRNVFVEPERVEDNERDLRILAYRLRADVREWVAQRRTAIRWTALAAMALALIASMRTAIGALLLRLFRRGMARMARMARPCGQSA